MNFTIGSRKVAFGHCFIICEVAQSHDGSLGMAHAYIDAIATTGADAVKFQTHIAEAESSPDEPWRVQFSFQDSTRYEYWKRMEFTLDQWVGLKNHAEQKGLIFLSSPFSLQAVDLLEKLGVDAWKVASGEVTNPILIKYLARTGKPLLLSSGMSTKNELDAAIHLIQSYSAQYALMQCTSSYPTPPEKVGLNLIHEYRDRYCCNVGLSDHSGKIYPSLSAVTLGASLLEIHVTLSREMFGPDVCSSITTRELAMLVEGVRFIETALLNPVDKEVLSNELADTRRAFTKSLYASADIEVGTIITPAHIDIKKPAKGIPAAEYESVIGKVISNPLYQGDPFRYSDFVDLIPPLTSIDGLH